MMKSIVLVVSLLLSLCAASPPVCAASPPVQAPLIKDRHAVVDWLTVLLQRLPLLEHERGNRWPLILWEGPGFTPLPEATLKALLSRGIVPHLRPDTSMIQSSLAIQAAGGPVILMAGKSGAWGYGNPKVVAPADISGWAAAGNEMRNTLTSFRDAGVKVDAVWLDYEVNPLNLNYSLVRDNPTARRHIPDNVLSSPKSFSRWTRQMWIALMSAYIAGPVREVFPGASVSNWMTVLSTSSRPVPGMIGNHLSPTDPGLFTATNPVAYGTDAGFWYNGGTRTQSRDEVDRRYMALLLGQVSADAANRLDGAPHLGAVPWVGRWVPLTQSPESKAGGLGVEVKESKTGLLIVTIHPGSPAEQAGLLPGDQITAVDGEQLSGQSLKGAINKVRGHPGSSAKLNIRRGVVNLDIAFKRFRIGGDYHPIMSRVRYREALRHLWLRGIEGMQVFNNTTPGHAEIAISEVEDAQKIYDEMLAFRRFQERGFPINLAPYTPEMTLLWSGLRLDDEVIIRAISLRKRADMLNVEPWPGAHISLSASTEGTTWLLQYDPDTQQVMKLAID
jgi:carboxyl-terminal processing protease